MDDNSYIKYYEGFNPENLVFDESFTSIIRRKTGSSPEARVETFRIRDISVDENVSSLKTGGAIHSGFVILQGISDRVIFAAANIRGEIYYFEQNVSAVKAVSKVTIQGAVYVPPVFSRGVLYCAVREGVIYAVATTSADSEGVTGGIRNRILWHRKMKKGIFAEPVLDGRLLLVTTTGGVFAFDIRDSEEPGPASGLWAISINGTLSTPAADNGRIFIGSEDKRLFGFDYSTGSPKKLWEYDIDSPCRMKPCVLSTIDAVAAASVNGSVYALDRASGKCRWNFAAGASVIGNMASGMISGVEHIFFGSDDGNFYCMDSSGKKLWDFKTGGKIRSEPAVSGNRVFFGSEDGFLYGLDMVTGREIFRHKTGGIIYGRPLLSGDRIYFGSTDGYIYSAGL